MPTDLGVTASFCTRRALCTCGAATTRRPAAHRRHCCWPSALPPAKSARTRSHPPPSILYNIKRCCSLMLWSARKCLNPSDSGRTFPPAPMHCGPWTPAARTRARFKVLHDTSLPGLIITSGAGARDEAVRGARQRGTCRAAAGRCCCSGPMDDDAVLRWWAPAGPWIAPCWLARPCLFLMPARKCLCGLVARRRSCCRRPPTEWSWFALLTADAMLRSPSLAGDQAAVPALVARADICGARLSRVVLLPPLFCRFALPR